MLKLYPTCLLLQVTGFVVYCVLVSTLPQEFHLSQYILPFLLTSVTTIHDTMHRHLTIFLPQWTACRRKTFS